ncbi:DUF732 domain-containing protein [Mycobacterium sp. NAZ190054]|uniref:DUF732 domain-containing protein n=1 Tax=Mycobacterium sp. NAZ190054 TaxID=1747766 RepID=UPI00079129E7|nr:DUF732 domain-containing protein [Mycobacterium sp. NAZ190054]KWX63205.1 hypothetical protein ASJ79_08485 [Mycobacterium sp. NAZ190054]
MKRLVVLFLALGALVAAPPANANDQAYLDELTRLGLPPKSPDGAINAANVTCAGLDTGISFFEAVYHTGIGGNLTTQQAGDVVSTVIRFKCPQYLGLIPPQ